MKLTRCENGHFYDAEKYGSCPHCSGGSGVDSYGGGDDRTVGIMNNDASYSAPNDFDTTRGGDDSYYGRNMNMAGGERVTEGFNDWRQNYMQNNRPTEKFGSPYQQMPSEDDDEGKTVAYMATFPGKDEDDPGVRVNQIYQQKRQGQPVVGWLVCVEGDCFGNSFNLYGGKNFIGRSPEMDICLPEDRSVSRFRHAIVVYEPKARKFFVQPGESHELFYLNDNVVLTSEQLNDRDVITIGDEKLVFVPFCDERFGWGK